MKCTMYSMARRMLVTGLLLGSCAISFAQEKIYDDKLGPGDTLRIQVFQNPDLTLETRLQESGNISYPLIGSVKLAGLSVVDAEKLIAAALKSGGFMQLPQVTIATVQSRRKQVSVLGSVGRPGQFPLEAINTKLSDMVAIAGGISPAGSDTVIVTGQRDGKSFRQEVNMSAMYLEGKVSNDIVLQGGDVVYVNRAPVFYVYGEAQRPGAFRLERNMTFMQALVMAGGPSSRGTEKRLRLHRQNLDGVVKELPSPDLVDLVQPDDVIFVRESLF